MMQGLLRYRRRVRSRPWRTAQVEMSETDDRTRERYRLHAEICKVLTDGKRLMLIEQLHEGERSVGDLASRLGCTMANASQHLAVLRSAGLVDTRRDGTTILYRLAEPEIVDACRIVQRIVERRMRPSRPAVPDPQPVSAASPASR